MNLVTLYKRAIRLLAAAPKSAADPEPTCRPPAGSQPDSEIGSFSAKPLRIVVPRAGVRQMSKINSL